AGRAADSLRVWILAGAQHRTLPLPGMHGSDQAGAPTGDLTPWDEIRFPFDPRLAGLADLSGIPVERHEINAGQRIEEEYEVSSSGTVTVRLRNVTAAYQREYLLGRWAAKKAPAATARRRHRVRPGS